jgi:Putative  PD-(D/E)XK family member, (DUF4420)
MTVTTTMATDDRWDELGALGVDSSGAHRLRVAPSSPHDLFIGVVQPGRRRCFWYEVSTAVVPPDYRLPPLRSVRTTIGAIVDAPETMRIQLELENSDLDDVYKAMVNDLVGAIAVTPDDDNGLSVLSQRTERWRRLLQSGTGGLGSADRRGLAGELIVLDQLLDHGPSAIRVVEAWTGPYGKHQDFQGSQIAIEVKTTVTKQPQSLIIASERELDSTGVASLYLMHVSLDERQGGSGHSLNVLVSSLRARLQTEATALAAFEDALLSYGYLNDHMAEYDTPNYTVRDQNAFEVRAGFPRITEVDLPIGVGDVTYRIQLAALQPYVSSVSDVLAEAVAL